MTDEPKRTVDFLPTSEELQGRLDANIREAKLLRATLKLALRAEGEGEPPAGQPGG